MMAARDEHGNQPDDKDVIGELEPQGSTYFKAPGKRSAWRKYSCRRPKHVICEITKSYAHTFARALNRKFNRI